MSSVCRMAPTLTTARLTMTGHRRADLDACAAMWADPRVYAMIGGKPRVREEVWLRLLRSVGQWQLFGYGGWVVRETASGRFVGDVGLIEAERAIMPPLTVPEVGWAVVPAFHGQGMAREAVEAALDWADRKGPRATCCIIHPDNAASIRLAERVGYRFLREARYSDAPTLVFERTAPGS